MTPKREAEIRRWVDGEQAWGDAVDDDPRLKRDLLALVDELRLSLAAAEKRAAQSEAASAGLRAVMCAVANVLTEHIPDGCAGPDGTPRRGACMECREARRLRASAAATPAAALGSVRARVLMEAADAVAKLAAEDEARRDAYYREHRIPGYMSTHRAVAGRDAERALRAMAEEAEGT